MKELEGLKGKEDKVTFPSFVRHYDTEADAIAKVDGVAEGAKVVVAVGVKFQVCVEFLQAERFKKVSICGERIVDVVVGVCRAIQEQLAHVIVIVWRG